MKCNDNREVKADTPLWFTVNGVSFQYTIHELETALTSGEAYEPGARELLRLLGPCPAMAEDKSTATEQAPRKPGRPPKAPEKAAVEGSFQASHRTVLRKSG
jgi:hypothetical protein